MEMHHEALIEAMPGDNVGFNVKNVSVKELKARIRGLDFKERSPPRRLAISYCYSEQLNFHHKPDPGWLLPRAGLSHRSYRLQSLPSSSRRSTGVPVKIEANPKQIKSGDSCNREDDPQQTHVRGDPPEVRPLGRFAVRMKQTVAVGVIY